MKEAFEKIVERLVEKMGRTRFYQATNECNDSYYDGEVFAYGRAIDIVNQVAEEYGSDGWIPCSEKMPPLYKPILLTVDVNGEMEIEIAEWLGDFEWMFDDEFYTYTEADWKVIAWRELPEPYQPKGE